MDTVYLRDIELQARIGVFEWEQHIEQKLILSLQMRCDCRAAAQDDDLQQGVDYGAVLRRVQNLVANSRVKLLETLAEQIAQLILSEFAVTAVTVDLAKVFIFPAVPRVGVVIERQR
jgi:dihydroneopterin aldolase